jgi:predicted dehydrogenase
MEIKLRESIDSGGKVIPESFKEQPGMYTGMHHGLVKDLIEAIEEDREPEVNGREGLKALRIITAIYESSREKKEVKFA